MNPFSKIAVGAEVTHSFATNENTITVGTQHELDPLTKVKVRVNNLGKANALIQHEWRPKSLFTIFGDISKPSLFQRSQTIKYLNNNETNIGKAKRKINSKRKRRTYTICFRGDKVLPPMM
jgi:hypothetical protein